MADPARRWSTAALGLTLALGLSGGLLLGRYVLPASPGVASKPTVTPSRTVVEEPPELQDHLDLELGFGLQAREGWRFVPAAELPKPHQDAAIGFAGPDGCLGVVRVSPRSPPDRLAEYAAARLAALPVTAPQVLWNDAVVYDAEGTARRFQVRGYGPTGVARVQVTVLFTDERIFEVAAWSGPEFLVARRCFDHVTAAFYRRE